MNIIFNIYSIYTLFTTLFNCAGPSSYKSFIAIRSTTSVSEICRLSNLYYSSSKNPFFTTDLHQTDWRLFFVASIIYIYFHGLTVCLGPKIRVFLVQNFLLTVPTDGSPASGFAGVHLPGKRDDHEFIILIVKLLQILVRFSAW